MCTLIIHHSQKTSLVAQMLKNLPAMQETWIPPLGLEDPLEREWQPTPVFLPGEFHEQRSLAGYSPWGCKELDMTERLTHFYSKVHFLRCIHIVVCSCTLPFGLLIIR